MRGKQHLTSDTRAQPRARSARRTLGPDDWILAARRELIARGVAGVKVDRLARRLRVTRGSFYWHFKNHAHLLRELLKFWEDTNTAPFVNTALGNGSSSAVDKFRAINEIWVQERDYSAAFDTAVRDWARLSREAADCVRRTDAKRIDILHLVFKELGYSDPEALVRARITYFHQVGYYALEFKEDAQHRRALVPVYIEVLMGQPARQE
jgi:AcrR family transcriptional regulator